MPSNNDPASRIGLLERAATTAQFLAESLESPSLSDDDLHHLSKVLRARVGESVCVTDGVGSWRLCVWTGSGLEPASEISFEEAPTVPVSIGFALLKGDKPEWVVQKLTEIGVDNITPVTSMHTVVRWDAMKAQRNHQRLQRVAYEAAMQSRRVWMPTVHSVQPLVELFANGYLAAHPGGDSISLEQPCIVAGPEGGFAPEELVRSSGTVDLGSTILRAETAAITLGVLLCARRAK